MIREVTHEDIPFIKQSKGPLFENNASLTSIEDAIFKRAGSLYFIALTPQKVGYIGVHLDLETAEIVTLFVAPEARSKGIGNRLLNHALKELKTRGITRILLDVCETNQPARTLYLNAGFKWIHTRPNYYPDGCAAWVMQKEL